MDKLLELLAQHGPFALISGGLIYLFSILWKKFQDMYQEQHNQLFATTTAIGKLTSALEDVVASVEAQGERSERGAQDCKTSTKRLLDKVEEHLEECRMEKAREEGRRSVTNPHGVPIPRGDES